MAVLLRRLRRATGARRAATPVVRATSARSRGRRAADVRHAGGHPVPHGVRADPTRHGVDPAGARDRVLGGHHGADGVRERARRVR
ncbi:hypothetical protein ABTL60_19475, partial [Acinetobacter baumannii]